MDKETRGRFLAIEAEERREALTTQPNVNRIISELKEEIWRARIEVEVASSQAREITRRIDDMELQLSALTGAERATPVQDRQGCICTDCMTHEDELIRLCREYRI